MLGCWAPQGQIRRELIRSAAMENTRRSLILYHYNNGVRKIHELMNLTGMKKSAVYNNLNKIKEGKPIQRKKGSGRKSRLSTSDKKRIIQLAIQNPLLSSREIGLKANQMGTLPVCARTILRQLGKT